MSPIHQRPQPQPQQVARRGELVVDGRRWAVTEVVNYMASQLQEADGLRHQENRVQFD